ncbi:MAG: hypothetical protein JWN34_1990 [Bryobacterales bacterium]|nr:hypothetical protein [Bryobacterales bacterium]
MGAKSSIGWTDSTWNPIRGCSMAKGSETKGCLNCYAARLNARNLPEMKSPTTGEPFARILASGPRWTGKVEFIEKALTLPLKWRQPKRIFVNSLSDLFHEALTDAQIDRVFAVMALCPQHTFQVLTKRPERMLAYISARENSMEVYRLAMGTHILTGRKGNFGEGHRFPLPNVWLGVSVEDQETANARIPLLMETPAAKRFVSYEPALGPVDFTKCGPMFESLDRLRPHQVAVDHGAYENRPALDWVIVGGESGPGARAFDVEWARNTVQQCKAAGVACFVKQLGAKPVGMMQPEGYEQPYRTEPKLEDRKGGDPLEWPQDLRVQEFPGVTA